MPISLIPQPLTERGRGSSLNTTAYVTETNKGADRFQDHVIFTNVVNLKKYRYARNVVANGQTHSRM